MGTSASLFRKTWPYLFVVALVGGGLLLYKPKTGVSPKISHPIASAPDSRAEVEEGAPGGGRIGVAAISPEDTIPDSGSDLDLLLAEAQETTERYFRKRIIRCGDSYFFYRTNWLNEAKGELNISASGAPPARREISFADSLNGVRQSPLLWEGQAIISMDVVHVAASEKGAIAPTSYQTAWKQHQSMSYRLEKDSSGWKLRSDLLEITCSDVDEVLAHGRRG